MKQKNILLFFPVLFYESVIYYEHMERHWRVWCESGLYD